MYCNTPASTVSPSCKTSRCAGLLDSWIRSQDLGDSLTANSSELQCISAGAGSKRQGVHKHTTPPPGNVAPPQPTMMNRIARVAGAKILPSVDHITRIAAAAAAGKDGVATAGREEVRKSVPWVGRTVFHPTGPLGPILFEKGHRWG